MTEREKECLLFVANGRSYDFAPEYLGISRNTLLSHLKNIYLKLCVNDKAQAVYRAIQFNLIPVIPPGDIKLQLAS